MSSSFSKFKNNLSVFFLNSVVIYFMLGRLNLSALNHDLLRLIVLFHLHAPCKCKPLILHFYPENARSQYIFWILRPHYTTTTRWNNRERLTRALQGCGPSSIYKFNVIRGLSLLVFHSAPRAYSPGTPVFLSL